MNNSKMFFHRKSYLLIFLLLLMNAQVVFSGQKINYSLKNDDSLKFKPLRIIENGRVINEQCGTVGSDKYFPSIAHDKRGNYIVVWSDKRIAKNQIYAQLFANNDEKICEPFLVEDEPAFFWGKPDVAYNKITDEFIVTWIHLHKYVALQRVNSNGSKIGSNIKIFEFLGLFESRINVFQNGNIILTFSSDEVDFRPSELYFCVLNAEGKIITSPRYIHSNSSIHSSLSAWGNSIAVDTLGNAAVVWNSYIYPEKPQVYIQSINQSGLLNGSPVPVIDSVENTVAYYPQISSMKDGHYLVSYLFNRSLWIKTYKVGLPLTAAKKIFPLTYYYETSEKLFMI